MSSPYPQQPGFPPKPGDFPQQSLGPYGQPPKESGSGCGMPVLIGCGVTLLVSVLLCVGAVWWVKNNFDRMVARMGREFFVAMVNESEIPEEEKKEVITQIDRLVTAYDQRKIDQQDLQRMIEKMENSPIFVLIGSWGLDQAYLMPSGLSDEEKAAGRVAIERAMRGVIDKKITQEQFNAAMPQPAQFDPEAIGQPPVVPVPGAVPPGGQPPPGAAPPPAPTPPPAPMPPVGMNPNQPQQVTDEQVREMIAKFKKLADDAGIPEQPEKIDIGDEVKKMVDEAFAEENIAP